MKLSTALAALTLSLVSSSPWLTGTPDGLAGLAAF
jgi:hypothetical protein